MEDNKKITMCSLTFKMAPGLKETMVLSQLHSPESTQRIVLRAQSQACSRDRQARPLGKDRQGGGTKGTEDMSQILFMGAPRTTLRPVCKLQRHVDFRSI